jgi:Fe-S cluster assembly protein SufD
VNINYEVFDSKIIHNYLSHDSFDYKITSRKAIALILSLKDYGIKTINIYLEKQASLVLSVFDFTKTNTELAINLYLQGKEARCYLGIATIANKVAKKYQVQINNKKPQSVSELEIVSVARNGGNVSVNGYSKIYRNSHQAMVTQKARGVVFDDDSMIKLAPELRIDHNDVVAAHSLSVGEINPDEVFYLTSRGFSKSEAHNMILRGYFRDLVLKSHSQEPDVLYQEVDHV